MWICLVTAVLTGIDDHLGGRQDIEDMYRFNERFVNCHTQANPVLEALDTLLREAPRYYSPLASNLLTTSILDFMSSMLLDYKTKDVQIPTQTPSYPEYCRTLSGLANLFAFLIFPSTIPLEDYIHSMPDLCIVIGYENDILSFYKEEIVSETANFVSLRAVSRGITKLDALYVLIDQAVRAHHNVFESPRVHIEAYDAYVSFFNGYTRFHASARYKPAELMAERSSCNDA